MNKHKKLVILSGAGISAESGLKTFRGSEGLWENHRIEDVATPQAWDNKMEIVLRFYDERRIQVINAQPNEAHFALSKLESQFDVQIITQNIDDLHERAGSTQVLHLHGEIMQARSSIDENYVIPLQSSTIPIGMTCPQGSQMRPNIVWFGEAVPMLEKAATLIQAADLLVIIGTSLNVYPAAGLVHYAKTEIPVFVIDPNEIRLPNGAIHVKEKASIGLAILAEKLKTD